MKKLFITVILIVLCLLGAYLWNGTGRDLLSSVMIHGKAYHDNAPQSIDTALVTPPGFTRIPQKSQSTSSYTGVYEKDGERYGVSIILVPESRLRIERGTMLEGFFATPSSQYEPLRYELVRYDNNDIFLKYRDTSVRAIQWVTDFGHISIFPYSTKLYRPEDLFAIARAYLGLYSAIPATKYASLSPRAAQMMSRRGYDPNNLRAITY